MLINQSINSAVGISNLAWSEVDGS